MKNTYTTLALLLYHFGQITVPLKAKPGTTLVFTVTDLPENTGLKATDGVKVCCTCGTYHN